MSDSFKHHSLFLLNCAYNRLKILRNRRRRMKTLQPHKNYFNAELKPVCIRLYRPNKLISGLRPAGSEKAFLIVCAFRFRLNPCSSREFNNLAITNSLKNFFAVRVIVKIFIKIHNTILHRNRSPDNANRHCSLFL